MDENRQISSTTLLWVGFLAFVVLAALCMLSLHYLVEAETASHSLTLAVATAGSLAVIVALVLLLVVFYKVAGIEDKTQALGLPVGSVRALLAFCLVLMFVGLGVFLYEGVSKPGAGEELKNVTIDQVNALRLQYNLVVPRPAANPPKPAPPPSGAPTKDKEKPPGGSAPEATNALYDVTYFPQHSKDADEFAKLLFTQLATVFVTVVGFYFGSSTASAGVGAGVLATGGPPIKTAPTANSSVHAELLQAKGAMVDAQASIGRMSDVLAAINEPGYTSDQVRQANTAVTDARAELGKLQRFLADANAAAAKYGTLLTEVANNDAAADVTKAADAAKQSAADIAKAEKQLNQIRAAGARS